MSAGIMTGRGLVLAVGLAAALVAGWRLLRTEPTEVERRPPPVQVRVLDDLGAPLSGAWVGLYDVTTETVRPGRTRPRFGSRYDSDTSAETDADGRASLEVPCVGRWRVWAGARLFDHAPSAELVLDGDSPAVALTLTLQPVAADRIIAGRLVGPDGAPVARGMVSFYWLDQGEVERCGGSADADGRFAFVVPRPELDGALLARKYRDPFGSVLVEPVRAGQRDLLVRLRPRRTVDVDVRGSDGEPGKWPGVTLERRILGQWVRDSFPSKGVEGAPVVVATPSVPYRLLANAGYHRRETLGPFEPDELGATLTVELERLAHVAGRVTVGGEPVAGARVMRMSGRGTLDHTYTDAEGRFELTYHAGGTFDLVARKQPHGDGRLRDVVHDAQRGVDGLEIELTPGGAVHGRLRVPAGERPEELYVHFRGDAETFFTAVDADGRFFVEGLTAGAWALSLGERWPGFPPEREEIGTRQVWFDASPDTPPAWWSPRTPLFVELEVGERVDVEWDATRAPACTLEGVIRLDGRAPERVRRSPLSSERVSGCSASLQRAGDPAGRSSAPTDDDGRFALAVDEPGSYELHAWVWFGDGSSLRVRDRVELRPGVQRWSFDVETGTVVLELGEATRPRRHNLDYRWLGPGERSAVSTTGFEDRERGLWLFARVPAGRGEVFDVARDAPPEALAEFDVPAGGEARVELP